MRFLSSALFVPIMTCTALAAPPDALLILPFDNATGLMDLNPLRQGLPNLITAFLAAHSDAIHVVERQKLDAIMAEQGLKWESVMSEKAYGRLGQLAQARYVLRGSFSSMKTGLRIEALLYETETTWLLRSFEVSGERKEINAMCEKIALNLASAVAGRPLEGPAGWSGELPADPDPETNFHLIYGLGYYHQAQYAKAIPEFMKVLAAKPRLADAKYWLYKSYRAAGLMEDAALEGKEFSRFFPGDPRSKEMRGQIP